LEDNHFRRRHAKRCAVHFFGGQHKVVNAFGNGMMRGADTDFLGIGGIACLAPAAVQVAGRAEHRPEWLGVVAGVQGNKAQALMHGGFDALRQFVGDFIMAGMAPPDQHIIVCQIVCADALVRVV